MVKILKRFLICLCAIVFSSSIFIGCAEVSDSVVRIHIRANSNSSFDQEVKLKVRDEIVKYITPEIESCKTSDEVKVFLNDNIEAIERLSDSVLLEHGCDYTTSASVNNEFFPSRDYDGVSFPADYYDALIVRLGSGIGDNWWCVAYPPLCFVNSSSDEVEYRSKLVEIISKLLK